MSEINRNKKEYYIVNILGKLKSTLVITCNGTFDVLDYESVEVDVETLEDIVNIIKDYHYFLSREEAKAVLISQGLNMQLPTKELKSHCVVPYIEPGSRGLELIINDYVYLDELETGEIALPNTNVVSSAYIIKNGDDWALFYNLQEGTR